MKADTVIGPRQSMVERWREYDPARKALLAGDAVAQVEDLVGRVDGMSDDAKAAESDTRAAKLRAVKSRLRETRAHEARLLAERNVLAIELAALGVPQKDIAEAAGVTAAAVGQVIGSSEKTVVAKRRGPRAS